MAAEPPSAPGESSASQVASGRVEELRQLLSRLDASHDVRRQSLARELHGLERQFARTITYPGTL